VEDLGTSFSCFAVGFEASFAMEALRAARGFGGITIVVVRNYEMLSQSGKVLSAELQLGVASRNSYLAVSQRGH
jgi:hypothetical protein